MNAWFRLRNKVGGKRPQPAGWLARAGWAALLMWLAGLAAAAGQHLDPYELSTLFRLRGPRPPPADVVIVSIDRQSSRELGLAPEPEDWSRAIHARLVDALNAAGARTIVFDIFFRLPRDPQGDAALARSLAAAGNAVLCDYLRRDQLPWGAGSANGAGLVNIESTIPPLPLLKSAARASAPFPLPQSSTLVHHGWVFKSGAGEHPTLPAAALQLHARDGVAVLLESLRRDAAAAASMELLAPAGSELDPCSQVMRLRELFRRRPELARHIEQDLARRGADPAMATAALQLLDLYSGPETRLINYYGPPRSIATIPLRRVLGSSPPPGSSLRNKAVFIGLSDPFQTEQKDYYLTPFSSSEGPDVSGVEIAATVFANLLDRGGLRRLRPTSQAVLLGLWAALLAGCALRLSTGRALGAITGLGLVYFAGAVQLFARQALWLPVAAPLLAMVPPALGATVIGHIRQVRRERRQIQDAVGFYLPAQAVAELVDPQRAIGERWQVARGVCMATDAAQYSHLAERMPPEALSRLMNRYYEALFRPIRARGGMISDIVGDAMMALWACPPAPSVDRHSACLAALEVLEAVADFNRAHADVTLPTRIGLHCGELVLGNVGAMDHYEYRAVGDVVNSASRLEGLNKSFGTRLLCSREMIEGLEDLLTRPLGNVLLAGKTRQLEVCELMGRRGTARPAQRLLCQRFGAALDAYSRRDWSRAAERFRQCLELHPDDGPSLYYLDVITNQRQDLRAGLVPGPEAMRAVHPIKHH